MTRRQLLRALSDAVWQAARNGPCCPQNALLMLLVKPASRDDWAGAAGGPASLRDVALDLHAVLPCTCGSRSTAP